MSKLDHHRFDLESLEQRLLLSADGFGVGMQDDRLDVLDRPAEVVVELATETPAVEASIAGGGSIFGDFAIEISFGDGAVAEVREALVVGDPG